MLTEIQNAFQHGSEWFIIISTGNYVYSDPDLYGSGKLEKVNITYAQWLMERDGFNYVEYGSF